jgi:hypothetical protein
MGQPSLEDVEEQDYAEHETDNPQGFRDDEEEQNLTELFGLLRDDSHTSRANPLLRQTGPNQSTGDCNSGRDREQRLSVGDCDCHLETANASLADVI